MFQRWSLVVGAVALGCAVEQVDEMPHDTATTGGASSMGGTRSSVGGTGGTVSGGLAGSSSASAGATAQGGTGVAGSNSGAAGTSHAGSAGKGAGGASSTGGGGTGGSGGSSNPANTNLPFNEDFEDGVANGFIPWNSNMTPGPWVVVADGAGKVYQPQAAVSALELAVGGSSTWTDVALTVKVRLKDASAGAQIVLRFKDAKNYLFVEMAVGKYKLRGKANGSSKDLVSPATKPTIAAGTWYTVGITAKGTAVSLSLDGMPIGTPAMCDPLISNGGVALGAATGSVSFDDVKVVAN